MTTHNPYEGFAFTLDDFDAQLIVEALGAAIADTAIDPFWRAHRDHLRQRIRAALQTHLAQAKLAWGKQPGIEPAKTMEELTWRSIGAHQRDVQ